MFSETNSWQSIPERWTELLVVELLVIAGISLLSILSGKFNVVLPWHTHRALRFSFSILSGLLIFIVLAIIFAFVYLNLKPDSSGLASFWLENREIAAKLIIIGFVLMVTYTLVDFWMYTYNQYSSGKIASVKLESDQKDLQFQALQSQLSPHFLFNSLNTISSLLYKDIRITEDFIRKLTQIYQYVLKTENRNLVALKEELDAIDAYFFMQKIKYGNSVEMNITIAPDLMDTFIPPLTLQMLVENALKHNYIHPEKVLKTEIYNDRNDFIVVRNNLVPKPELLKIGNNLLDRPDKTNSFTIGLNNIRNRYSFFTSGTVEIRIDHWYCVRLPVIRQNHGK